MSNPRTCVYCGETVHPEAIHTWVDHGQTPLCPHCEMDALAPRALPTAERERAHLASFSPASLLHHTLRAAGLPHGMLTFDESLALAPQDRWDGTVEAPLRRGAWRLIVTAPPLTGPDTGRGWLALLSPRVPGPPPAPLHAPTCAALVDQLIAHLPTTRRSRRSP